MISAWLTRTRVVFLSCLAFVVADALHIPVVRRSSPKTVEDYGHAADKKYRYQPVSSRKRQQSVGISLINHVLLRLVLFRNDIDREHCISLSL